jgi:hypothetical protein
MRAIRQPICAREFQEPETGVTWRVRLIRLTSAPEVSLWGGRVGPLVLGFENGVEARRLEPAPPDWRECDDATLRRYCEAAQPLGLRGALAGQNGSASERSAGEKPATAVVVQDVDEQEVACPHPLEG